MKWSLQQLFKYNRKPFEFDFTCDMSEYVKNIDDIISISEVKVSGVGQNVSGDRYAFDLTIDCTLTLEDSVTLDPIEYPMHLETVEVYDFVDEDGINLIEKNTINLEGVIWENILVNKPMRVTRFDSIDE